jgi:hypothetical protein
MAKTCSWLAGLAELAGLAGLEECARTMVR